MRCRCCLTRSKELVPHLGETPTRMPHICDPCLGLHETAQASGLRGLDCISDRLLNLHTYTLQAHAGTPAHAADRAVEMARSWKANLDPPLRTSASRAPPVQVLIVGQTSSNRSKTTPISSENVKPIAVH